MSRPILRAPSWIERGIFRAGAFGEHRGFSVQGSQSYLLARYMSVAPSFTSVPLTSASCLPGRSTRRFQVIGEVLAFEGSVATCRLVEHRDVRLDPALRNEPAAHLGRSIGAIGSQLLRIKAKALFDTADHRPGGPDLCLSDGAALLPH